MRIERIEWDGAGPGSLATRLRGAVPGLADAADDVRDIVAAVRERGDAAIAELAKRFGETAPASLRVDPREIAEAANELDAEVVGALRVAAANIEAVARAELDQLAAPVTVALTQGQRVEIVTEPVGVAGVYAPGGRGAYPSSVLMSAIPARVAGVRRLAVATPPGPDGRPNPAVLAACELAGVDEVFAVGGAQAIAALAYGTESIAAVDVIAGPGNRFVTEAKRLVAGDVGIDGIAGPSELVVVADGSANAEWIALDLCAQAEHGEDSPLAVITTEAELAARVAGRVAELAAERPGVTDAPLVLIEAPSLDAALELADAFAPEHLELAFDGAGDAARGRVAGCVFVGEGGATAFGDYAAGSNHVLPTGGAARFGGPLGPLAFMRRTSVVSVSREAARALAPYVDAIANAEGFPVHGESATARAKD